MKKSFCDMCGDEVKEEKWPTVQIPGKDRVRGQVQVRVEIKNVYSTHRSSFKPDICYACRRKLVEQIYPEGK